MMLGKAIVWGINGTMAYTGMATTANEPQSVDYTETYEEHESKSKAGETVGLYLFNKKEDLTIDFYPCDPSVTATAEAAIVLPAIGAKVTIAAMKGAVLNDSIWIYKGGGKISEGFDHEVKMTLPLRQYSSDISTAAT